MVRSSTALSLLRRSAPRTSSFESRNPPTCVHPFFVTPSQAFPLPKGYSFNKDLQAHPYGDIGRGSDDPFTKPQ